MSDVPRIGVAPPLEVQQDVVDVLEELLSAARAGEVQGLVYFAFRTEATTSWGFFGREVRGAYLRTAGMCAWLQRKAVDRWESLTEDAEKEP